MTPQLTSMSAEDKRIAIAQVLDWKWAAPFNRRKKYNDLVKIGCGLCRVFKDGSLGGHGLPDYLNSLDACHEMEKALINEKNEFAYQCELKELSGQPYGYRATAEQRCSAMLLALNLATK